MLEDYPVEKRETENSKRKSPETSKWCYTDPNKQKQWDES